MQFHILFWTLIIVTWILRLVGGEDVPLTFLTFLTGLSIVFYLNSLDSGMSVVVTVLATLFIPLDIPMIYHLIRDKRREAHSCISIIYEELD